MFELCSLLLVSFDILLSVNLIHMDLITDVVFIYAKRIR